MENHYIAPKLTVVAIHVERGYADSIRASNGVALNLTDLNSGCTGDTPEEERTVSTHWGSNEETNTFWIGEF